MRLILATSQRKAEIAAQRDVALSSALYDPTNRAIYAQHADKIIVKMHTFENKNFDDFVEDFAETMSHEMVHVCVNQEKKENKKLAEWYKDKRMGAILGEERVVYRITSDMEMRDIDYRLLQNAIYKSKIYHILYAKYRLRFRAIRQLYFLMWFTIIMLLIYIFIWGA
jgi:hypothetical protein